MPHLHRFYIRPPALASDTASLDGGEAHHALRVVRVQVGDEIALFDGVGNEAIARVAALDREAVRTEIVRRSRAERPARRLTLAVAWVHRDGPIEELVRRGTELGVSRFLFFRARRSERPIKSIEKCKRWALESCKQCGRVWLPLIESANSLDEAIGENKGGAVAVAALGAKRPLVEAIPPQGDFAIFIGPAGDFVPEELETLRAAGAVEFGLGPITFRTEAAALIAATITLDRWGQFEM
ncbi:MAG: RsmE family RNA methyltransferase [Candidatus Hydrogenedentota bacterium]